MKKIFTFTQDQYFMLCDSFAEYAWRDAETWTVTIREKDGFKLQVRNEGQFAYMDICANLNDAYVIKEACELCLEACRSAKKNFVDLACIDNCLRITFAVGADGRLITDLACEDLINIIEVEKYPEPYEEYLAWCASWDEVHGFVKPTKSKRRRYRKAKGEEYIWEPTHGWDEDELMLIHEHFNIFVAITTGEKHAPRKKAVPYQQLKTLVDGNLAMLQSSVPSCLTGRYSLGMKKDGSVVKTK